MTTKIRIFGRFGGTAGSPLAGRYGAKKRGTKWWLKNSSGRIPDRGRAVIGKSGKDGAR
jgi:hypothetical protein